jgi:hypothetical protein
MPHSDLISAAGDSLRLPDAVWLGQHSVQQDAASRSYLAQVDGHIQTAKSIYMAEPSIAGARAFGNFMDWFMPQVRGGANLNPRSDEYALGETPHGVMAQFAPTGNDLASAAPAQRKPLSEIFGGKS